jgi:hypothetical protein
MKNNCLLILIVVIVISFLYLYCCSSMDIEGFNASTGGALIQLAARDPQDSYETTGVEKYYTPYYTPYGYSNPYGLIPSYGYYNPYYWRGGRLPRRYRWW